MDSDMDELVAEEQLFTADSEPLKPRITIVDIDDTSPVVEEVAEVAAKSEGEVLEDVEPPVEESSGVGEAEIEGVTDAEGVEGIVAEGSYEGLVEGGGDTMMEVVEVEEVEEVVEEVQGKVQEILEGVNETEWGLDMVLEKGETEGVVEVSEEQDGVVEVPPGETDDVTVDDDIAEHIREWLTEAINTAGVAEMESLEDQMRRYILSSLEKVKDEIPPEEDFTEEVSGLADLQTDIRTVLVDSLIKLPGHETGLDESRWILHELRAWVNTAMGVKTFMAKQTSTSSIDRARRKIDRFLEMEDGKRFSEMSVAEEVQPRPKPTKKPPQQIMVHPPYTRRHSTKIPSLTEMDTTGETFISFLLDKEQVYTQEFPVQTKMSEVKTHISETFSVPADVIGFTIDECPVLDNLTLLDLGIMPFSYVDVKCFSIDPEQYPILVSNLGKVTSKKVEIRNVAVQISEETIKEVVVEVRDQSIRKPWVGGYRNKETKCEYHHAFSQTQPRNKCLKTAGKTSRDTQTAEWKLQVQNTVCEKATQMWRRDHYIPSDSDKIITPGIYTTHAEIEEKRGLLGHVLTIQRYTRAWLLKRWAARMSKEYRRIRALEEEAEMRRLEEKMKMIKRRITKKAYPRTRADFDMLYHMLEEWRLAEVDRITRLSFEASKKTYLYLLLEKELLILSCIEKHRVRVKEEALQKNELQFIDKSAKPTTWTGYKGHTVSMESSGSMNAKEFRQLYYSLCNHEVTVEQRINLLMMIKAALKPFNTCVKVLEVSELLERECDCLFRGLTHTELDMLRMRLRKAFIELLKDPALNPDAAKYTAPPMVQGNLKYCDLCRKLLPQENFKLNTTTKRIKHCMACSWTDNIGRPRLDFGPYRRILRALRKEEARRCCFSSVAFLMQEEDFYYLVVDIWQSHSAINKCDDLDDLVFSRWRVDEDWTPWNCILLTFMETRAHNRLRKSLEETYEEDFIEDVIVKHLEARVHYANLVKVDKRFRESGRWYNADMTIKFTAVH